MTPADFVPMASAAAAIQAVIRLGAGTRIPVGDEHEYIARAGAADPFGPAPFLRVPGFTLVARAAGRRHPEARLRDLMAGLSLVTAGCVAWSGHLALGPAGSWAALLLFMLVPDRVVLSQHIWPDMLLALCWNGASPASARPPSVSPCANCGANRWA